DQLSVARTYGHRRERAHHRTRDRGGQLSAYALVVDERIASNDGTGRLLQTRMDGERSRFRHRAVSGEDTEKRKRGRQSGRDRQRRSSRARSENSFHTALLSRLPRRYGRMSLLPLPCEETAQTCLDPVALGVGPRPYTRPG